MFLRSKPSLCSQINSTEVRRSRKKAQLLSRSTVKSIRCDIKPISTTRSDSVSFHAPQAYPINNTHPLVRGHYNLKTAGFTSVMDKLRRDASILYNYSGVNISLMQPEEIRVTPAFTMNVVQQAILTINKCQRMELNVGRINELSIPDCVTSNVMCERNV